MSRYSAALNDCLVALLMKHSAVLGGIAIASLALPQSASAANSAVTQTTVASHLNLVPLAEVAPGAISATATISASVHEPQFSSYSESPIYLAQAITPANDGTGTVVEQADNTFTITGGTQAGANLFHSFEQFGLDAGQIANIIANPDIANVLGRVVGGDPSIINGLLQVTGGNANLFLINPAGILFGPNSQINVPGIFTATTASALQIGDYWFNALGSNDYTKLVGTPNGFAFTGSSPGAIINAGSLNGESVTLLGGSVVNTGTIETPGGNITVAAVPGENLVRITQDGSVLSLDLPTNVRDSLSGSSQALTPLAIPALLTGGNVPQGMGLVAQEGAVRLASTNTLIPTSMGTTIVSGTLDASNNQEGVGGRIDVLGERVGLLNANLDASGNSDGGLVRVGGDYQGQGTIPNADNTYIDKNSVISADAVAIGNGGQVFVWSDDTTRFFGSISARGGAESGDGGFIEVSGREALAYQGQVDLNALAGRPGQLLLDPAYVTVGTGTTNDDQLNDGTITELDGGRFSSFQISIGTLVDALNNGNVSITASKEIRFNSTLNASSSSHNLSLMAPQILVEGDITIGGSLSLAAGNVQFGNYRGAALKIEATGSIAGDNIEVNRSVILSASGDIRTGSITAQTSFLGTPSETGFVSISSGGSFVAQEGTTPANILGESVNILAGRDIQVGYILADAGGINIDAGGQFRALNSMTRFLYQTRNFPSKLVNYISNRLRYTEFPWAFNINDFLVSLQTINGSIAIRYGQREYRQNLFNSTSITIQGDPSQTFYIGPNYDDFRPFLPGGLSNPKQNFEPYNSTSNPYGYFSPGSYSSFSVIAQSESLVFGTKEFPSNAGGTVAGISVTGYDSSLTGSLQSLTFGDTIIRDTSTIEVVPLSVQNLDIESRNLCDAEVAASSGSGNVLEIDKSLFASTQARESRSVGDPCLGTSASEDQENTSQGLPLEEFEKIESAALEEPEISVAPDISGPTADPVSR